MELKAVQTVVTPSYPAFEDGPVTPRDVVEAHTAPGQPWGRRLLLTGAFLTLGAGFSLAGESEAPDCEKTPVTPVPDAPRIGGLMALPAERLSYRSIAIPQREHGYQNFTTTVLRTQAELDGFLKKGEEQKGWNNREAFVSTLNKAKVDFETESLVLLRHREGSGSVQVTFGRPVLKENTLTCSITRKVPEMGTADMAYYCFALAVRKAKVNKVELQVDQKTRTVLPLAKTAAPPRAVPQIAGRIRAPE